ncbi:ACP S-malonyltransferase [Sulfurospirillum sp. 1612]|uniref:ACP S-malonyltransferase n=1 Tax=Sulfurospirillum sp. 1612 TaxID=3094835 RepID=UPI002F9543F3
MINFAGIFPGQGSQKVGMGKDFFEHSKIAREMIERASNRLDIDFENLLFQENENLEKTQFSQASILLVSMIAYTLFSEQVRTAPQYFLGHSLGEFSALSATGSLDYLDAVELVYHRGLFMTEACEGQNAGMMALLGLSDAICERVVSAAQESGKKIWIANYNNDGQIVIAGNKSDLEEMESTFKEEGAKRAILLKMSVASHCPILMTAQPKLKASLERWVGETFTTPIISNVTAQAYQNKADAVALLEKQLIMPVRYKQSIKSIEDDVDLYVEFGGNVLKGINKKITSKNTISITDMATLEKAVLEFA